MLRALARQAQPWAASAAPYSASQLAFQAGASAALLQWLRPGGSLQQSACYSSEAFRKLLHNVGPRSLEFQRQPAEEVKQEQERGFAVRALLTIGGYYSKESRLMRAAQRLYAAVTEQAANPAFLEAMGIPAEFQQTHSSLCLHIWLLLVRLRAEGKDGKQLAQMLYDDFQTDVEDRARAAGVRVRLAKQLTELEKQFYGSSMAYDRAMQGVGGNETLDTALYRNVYLLEPGKERDAALLARYVTRELGCLAMTPSEAVMAGNLKFSSEGLQPAGQEGAADAAAAGAAAEGGKAAEPAAGTTA